MTMNDSQRYPWHPYRINNVEDIFVFLFLKVFDSDNCYIFSCSRTLLLWRNPNWKILVFKIKNCENWSDHCELHNVSLYRETWRSEYSPLIPVRRWRLIELLSARTRNVIYCITCEKCKYIGDFRTKLNCLCPVL